MIPNLFQSDNKMKSKYILPLLAAGAMALGSMTACSDMMDTESASHRYDNGQNLDTAADSLYSVMGILSQVQKLGERYVLLGELRGDLMQATSDADFSLQEVSNFNISADNVYLDRRDYYSIINNCNYALQRINPNVAIHGEKVFEKEAAAIRTFRAWTYLQLALTFGEARYFTSPILSLEDSIEDYPTVNLDGLLPLLIADIEPISGLYTPDYGSVDGFNSTKFFINPMILLGDLYLTQNNYEQAAAMYYAYIERSRITMNYDNGNRWNSTSRDGGTFNNVTAYGNDNETIEMIPYSSNGWEIHPNLVNLTYHQRPAVVAADWFIKEMEDAPYYQADAITSNLLAGTLQGDCRGVMVYRDGKTVKSSLYGPVTTGSNTSQTLITKYYHNGSENSSLTNDDNEVLTTVRQTRRIDLCRNSHVYLRFAEAANRAGKPTLAFAVLKYGLRTDVMDPEAGLIDPTELESGQNWLNWEVLDLDNRGTAVRGRGLGIRLNLATVDYQIPADLTPEEKTLWVEDEIVREMAAETAFEGNRFFDLMRISRHRGSPAYFAETVSRRADNPAALAARLADQSNWYLK